MCVCVCGLVSMCEDLWAVYINCKYHRSFSSLEDTGIDGNWDLKMIKDVKDDRRLTEMDRNAAKFQIKLLWATPTSQARCSMELHIYAGWTTSDSGQALQIPHAVDCASGNWAIQTLCEIPICTGKSILHGYWHLSKHLSSIQTEYESLF